METLACFRAMSLPPEFKSYYVVWKLFFFNRIRHRRYWFKSYYVVWKLLLAWELRPRSHMFKSYYVVWKLLPAFTMKNTGRTFKSYYVVWKQYKEKDAEKRRKGLNRTMQYGNVSQLLQTKMYGTRFKSYYVVWKRNIIMAGAITVGLV